MQPAATSVRGDATTRGSFGLVTSPSAEGLQTNDTGDKVKCPVCQRGMDHWKSGERQQVIIWDITCGPLKALGPAVPLWAWYCRDSKFLLECRCSHTDPANMVYRSISYEFRVLGMEYVRQSPR